MTIVPRLQLWKEEAALVSAMAAAVPDGGTIVEIGTAEGGTAQLMLEACKGRGVEIYTVDIAPSRLAVENLRGTAVHMVAQPSEVFARTWQAKPGRAIDFLFIDGNHDLLHVVSDWNLWVPHLKPRGHVAFHDYDPPRRGGLAHLAVRICGSTILQNGLLREARHEYKMLSGRVDHPGQSAITAAQCRERLVSIAEGIRALQAAHASQVSGADDRLAMLLRQALRSGQALTPQRWTSPHSTGATGSVGVSETEHLLDSVSLCYLLDQALARDYAGLAEVASSHAEFLTWGEAIQMLNHGWTGPALPSGVPDAACSLAELSAFVAREQVRLVLLSRLLALFVDWQP